LPALFALVLFFTPIMHATEQSALPIAAATDNRTPAGIIRDGVLGLKLELRAACWYPEAVEGGHVDAYPFAEVGGPPQISGPLIRVPQETQIHLSVRNTLAEPAKVYGFRSHPAATNEPLSLAPGEQRELLFSAGDPGTYLYWATTSNHSIDDRDGPETTLGGAFVVDPPGARADDRVFVLNVWAKGLDTPSGAGNRRGQRKILALRRTAYLQNGRHHPLAHRQSHHLGPWHAPPRLLFHCGWRR
jgi:FtsP/CotA-like multicopper oxidase with cupredoxin domain